MAKYINIKTQDFDENVPVKQVIDSIKQNLEQKANIDLSNIDNNVIKDAVESSGAGVLPETTTIDNGKILQVVNGVWTPTDIESDIFISYYGMTTSNEIETAYNAGDKVLMCMYTDGVLYLFNKRISATQHTFVMSDSNQIKTLTCNSNIWSSQISSFDALPVVTTEDAGKFLVVDSSGSWVASSLPRAEGSDF